MVKILSQIELPELEQAVKSAHDDVDISYLGIGENVPAGTSADCLLAVASNLQGLDAVIADIEGLKWVQVVGSGIDGFPLNALGDRVLTTCKGVSAVPIAEWVMAMILTQAKSLPGQWISAPPETWSFGNAPIASLNTQKLALVGFGTIGRAIAQRALAFGMQVSAMTRTSTPDLDGVNHASSFSELVKNADHIVLAAPSTKATHHLLNRETFAALKPGAHLINIARGELVNEADLKTALDDGIISCASLDVAQNEPLTDGHWFYTDARIRFSPHISWGDPEIVERMTRVFLENLALFKNDLPLKNVFDVEAGY
ncbi:MAG: NAD(P)-dependent oxidoreductase [Parvibaculales bacterium]